MSELSLLLPPPDWKPATLGQVSECILGGTPSTEIPQFWNGDVPWMASGDVHIRRIRDVPGRITALGLRSSNATLTNPPAVAVGLAGQGKTRGTVALTLCTLSTNQSIALLKANGSDLRTDYLFHNLDRRYEELRARSSGGGRGGLSKAILEAVPIDLPPLSEQQKIAQVLDTLDTAIHETEAIIAKLKAVKQGLLHDLLTRGIAANGELRPPQAEAPHLYKESPLGWIPQEWEVSTVGEQFEIQLGKMLDSQKNAGVLKPYLGNKAVQWDWIDLGEVQQVRLSKSDLTRFRLQKGDLLVCEGGDVGRAAIWDDDLDECYYQKALHRLRPLRGYHPRLMLETLRYLMSRDALSEYISRTSIAHLTQEKLAAVPLPTPKVDEQERMVAEILTAKQRLETEESQLQKLRLLKYGLMDDLLTGRVRVTPLLEATP